MIYVNETFEELKQNIQKYPVFCGQYCFALETYEGSPFTVLKEMVRSLDDELASLTEEDWLRDHEDFEEDARPWLVQGLVGGPEFGHTREIMSAQEAGGFTHRFFSLFGEDRRFFTDRNCGARGVSVDGVERYIFSNLVIVLDKVNIGLMGVFRND